MRLMVYSNTCLLCKEVGKDTKYLGETARTMFERSRKHQGDTLRVTVSSHIRSHMLEEHPSRLSNLLTAFMMDVVKRTPSTLVRQVRETVEIERAPVVLNSEEDYNRCLLPRMIIQGPKSIKV
jgi:hypothetical protein